MAAIPEKAAKAIQSIKVSSKRIPGSVTDEIAFRTEIKFWAKKAALERLFKHFGPYEQSDRDDPVDVFFKALMDTARLLLVATGDAGSD